MRYYLPILILIFTSFSVAQNTPQNAAPLIEFKNGSPCHIHTIEKGQTLYSISKKYNVEVKQIEDLNGGLKEGLKLGATIYIPVREGKLTHIVEKGHTLYSIAKLYQTDKNIIIKDNKLEDENLKLGQILVINLSKKATTKSYDANIINESIDANPTSIIELKKEIEAQKNSSEFGNNKIIVALLLPLHLDKNFPAEEENTANITEVKTPKVYPKSYSALDFYNGVKLACDSVYSSKAIEIISLDCPTDTQGIQQILLNKELLRANIIVGPFNSNYAPFVAAYCKKYKKVYCTPFGQQGKILLNNEFAFKASASATTETESIAAYIKSNMKSARCVVVHNGLSKEKNLVEAFKLKYTSLGADTAKEVIFKESKFAGLKAKLCPTKSNAIVVCSNDQAFVTDFINKISTLKDEYAITVFGTEQWIEYENLEIPTIQNINLHIPSNYYIDYTDSLTKNFISTFRKEFYQEPSRASFLGFDLMSMMIATCQNEIISQNICENKFKGLHINFDFVKTSHESGYENHYTPILKYEDLMLKAVSK